MTPLVVAPLITGTPIADGAMSALLLYHMYAGFQSCIIDYIPKRVYGGLHNLAMAFLAAGTAVVGYGLYKIEQQNEDGLYGLLKKLWVA